MHTTALVCGFAPANLPPGPTKAPLSACSAISFFCYDWPVFRTSRACPMPDLESRVRHVMDSMRQQGAQIPPADLARALQDAVEEHGAPDALASTVIGVLACLRLYAADGLPEVFHLPDRETAH